MILSGCLSAFMNNIGVAALMLPVIMKVAYRTGLSPSKLLMPLAYGTLLGGLTTMLGTPPNLIASNALKQYGLESFSLFDFSPMGLSIMIIGILFVTTLGRKLLPVHRVLHLRKYHSQSDLVELYGLKERVSVLRLPKESILAGKRLFETRLTSTLGLVILGLVRKGVTRIFPSTISTLEGNDRLIVEGKIDRFNELKGWSELSIERESPILQKTISDKLNVAEVKLDENTSLANNLFDHANFRNQFGVIVLAIRRNKQIHKTNLDLQRMRNGDILLVQGEKEMIDALKKKNDFANVSFIGNEAFEKIYHLNKSMFVIRVPQKSHITGQSLENSRIGDAFDFRVLGLIREGDILLMPSQELELNEKDLLLVQGHQEDIEVLRGLQEFELEKEAIPDLGILESEKMGLLEAMLSPRSNLINTSVEDIQFEEKYGLRLLAIWRKGRSMRSDLDHKCLENGDAFLLLGPRDKLSLFSQDEDFRTLSADNQPKPSLAVRK